MVKTQPQILQDLMADFLANQNLVTYAGIDGVARAIMFAVSNVIAESWNDLTQATRKAFVETAQASDLDTIGARMGLTRNGATQSSAVLIFSGTVGTIIPAMTLIKSNISQAQFQTQIAITLGTANPSIQEPVGDNTIGDIVIAESVTLGSVSKVGVGELTQFVVPIAGVTVTNLLPSIGGLDAETDDLFRQRILNQIAILNQGTQIFYQTLAQNADTSVYSSFAQYNQTNLGTDLYLVKNSFAQYTSTQLTTIATAVYNAQRALSPVNCFNITPTGVSIGFAFQRDNSVPINTIYASLATQIASYINSKFGFGVTIRYQDILDIIIDTTGILNLNLPSFILNGLQTDLICGGLSVPRLIGLSISDGTTTINNTINQILVTP